MVRSRLLPLLILLGGCSPEAGNPEPEVIPAPAAVSTPVQIPHYAILEDQKIPLVDDAGIGYKRSVTVRLEAKASEDELRAVALKIRDGERQKFKRTFIVYLLPGMEPGKGAWAMTHFTPDLQVHVMDFMQDIHLREEAEEAEKARQEDARLQAEKERRNADLAARRKDADDAHAAASSRDLAVKAARQLRLARALEATNRPGALAYYRALAKDFPGTPEAKEAAARIRALGGE